ncbi:ACP phosphodiesterase [Arcicella rosea]|uniref:Acyl carrier protein phosphodiesterase n=1 Tax=Arcicella rosea TaxID=502909 RepID=A0A841EVH2_9BACT|nr:acyl carrier protein phosphodiesterase [Arcicella rosea]MBB6004638.1 acyl carrier protein phosphodiesterase [Arcicella rosea]
MNFLAHTFLSGDDDDIKIGNLMGDFIKGNLDNEQNSLINKGIINGIILHRAIDSFTDMHPVVRKSIHRLQPKYHKCAGIIVDVFYDHLLAKNFSDYSLISLPVYSQSFYRLIQERKNEMPVNIERLIHSMVTRDWFNGYATSQGIEWSLKGISQRLRFVSGIENATEDLKRDYDLYLEEFRIFFPELISYCQDILAKQQNAKI